jgi:1,4-dihydroxy-2-naphthoyl-CoA hydrolase
MIWKGDISLGMINDLNRDTMGEALGIVFTGIGDDHLAAEMPFSNNTRQPFGLLHGGASVALAETMGSVATWCAVNREAFIGVGVEITANHIKPVTSGKVTAICKAVKVDGRLHIWDISIRNEGGELCCVSRFTCMVVPNKK